MANTREVAKEMAGAPGHLGATASDSAAAIRGPSFPKATKWIVTLLLAALAVWSTRLWPELASPPWNPGALAFTAALVAGIVAGWWGILTSETSIDGRAIRQKGLWNREVALADVTGVKLVYVPALAWLFVPRLVVRRRGLGLATFTAGDARLLEAFRLLVHGAR